MRGKRFAWSGGATVAPVCMKNERRVKMKAKLSAYWQYLSDEPELLSSLAVFCLVVLVVAVVLNWAVGR